MKIFYFTVGGSIHDYRFLNKLVENRYDTYYIYTKRSGGAIKIERLKSIYIGGFGGKFLGRVCEILKALTRLKKILKEIRPDILHTGYVLHTGIIGALSGFHPVLLMPWGSDILIDPYQNRVYFEMTKYTLKRADMITCDAEVVKRKIIEIADYDEKKIVIFPWGVELDIFKRDDNLRKAGREKINCKDKKVLIMTRSLKKVYGIKYFIYALKEVVEKEKNILALIIGGGPEYKSLRELVSSLELDEYIRFLGECGNRELPLYLNAADIYVSSSLSDGTSLSLLEAMACGLPVIVTDVPAILEWVEQGVNGEVVRREDVNSLAEAILKLVADESMCKRYSRKNLEITKERADWDKNFEKLMSMYESLMKGIH